MKTNRFFRDIYLNQFNRIKMSTYFYFCMIIHFFKDYLYQISAGILNYIYVFLFFFF
jgi:hypothetical protein